jgi:hypothetical protein
MPLASKCSHAIVAAILGLATTVSMYGYHSQSADHGSQAKTAAATLFVVDVPLLDCDGTPCIEVQIGGQNKLRFGIDTGNVDSVIEAKTAAKAGLEPTEAPKSGAPAGIFRTVVPTISIGAVKLTDVGAMGMDLSEMISQKQMPHVDGTLAYPAFKDRVVELDFISHRMRISEPLTAPNACADRCDKISLLTFGKDGPPIVVADGFEINGVKISAQIDTMFTGAMLIYTSSIEKLGLSEAAKTKATKFFPLTDGGVSMKMAEAQEESFHGQGLAQQPATVYFPTEAVHEPDGLFDATVGLELFRHSVVTLNFHDMAISLRTNQSK